MRLTHKKEDWYWKDEEFWLSAENPSLEKADEIYYKLAEFEDFMEEQGLEDLGHLKMQLDQYENCMVLDHDTGKWLKISDIMAESQALKARWEKLKEYLTQKPEDGYVNCYFEEEILAKMQELEEEC